MDKARRDALREQIRASREKVRDPAPWCHWHLKGDDAGIWEIAFKVAFFPTARPLVHGPPWEDCC